MCPTARTFSSHRLRIFVFKKEGKYWTSYGNFLKKLKTELLYDPPVQLLGIYPRGSIAFYRDFYICIFTADLFTIVGKWRQFRMANCRGMDNKNVIYTTIYLLFIE